MNSVKAPTAGPKANEDEVVAPPKKLVTEAIPGVDVMDIEDAVQSLWREKIYAESGMGCTGPIIMVAPEDKDNAVKTLKEQDYL